MSMRDGLVCGILHEAHAPHVDFVHAAGILRKVACGATLEDSYLQGSSGGYLLRHDQAAPPAANDDHVRGFKTLQRDVILSALSPAKDA
jgi:hypothetical protein